jgi:hypothetical protein
LPVSYCASAVFLLRVDWRAWRAGPQQLPERLLNAATGKMLRDLFAALRAEAATDISKRCALAGFGKLVRPFNRIRSSHMHPLIAGQEGPGSEDNAWTRTLFRPINRRLASGRLNHCPYTVFQFQPATSCVETLFTQSGMPIAARRGLQAAILGLAI